MSKFRIYNGFGITPTKSYNAAGWDFYIPAISDVTDTVLENRIREALKKSYKKTNKQLDTIIERFANEMQLRDMEEEFEKWKYSILLLFFGIDGAIMRSSQNKVATFISYYLIWEDETGRPGIAMHCNDHLFINSGIKVALDHNTVGLFDNKSGRGMKGIDVRAKVVDEDYSGYVHLNVAYTKDNFDDGLLYAGDKLIQMLILPFIQKESCEEMAEEDYDELMKDSARGSDGFGSTDKK